MTPGGGVGVGVAEAVGVADAAGEPDAAGLEDVAGVVDAAGPPLMAGLLHANSTVMNMAQSSESLFIESLLLIKIENLKLRAETII